PWSLRETPMELQRKYFRKEGLECQLAEEVRLAVFFELRNLMDDDPSFWAPQRFDVVLCRNVVMYLTSEVTRSLICRIAKSLAPGGFLFLGHAETLRNVSQEFHLRHTHETFYYQLREAEERASDASQIPAGPGYQADGKGADRFFEASDAWYAAIRDASERIRALTHGATALSSSATPRETGRSEGARREARVCNHAATLELLREEKFEQAKALVRGLAAEAQEDSDTQVLWAVLLANSGEPREAESVCKRLLASDELNAGAHYVMALCREQAGDLEAASEHDRAATYLDSTFAMPHLHLGLMSKRLSQREESRRELSSALELLAHEDASRILLFGGGFTREGLVGLCRRELGNPGDLR